MFAGIALVLRPLSVIADVVPIAGSMVGAGTMLVAGLRAASLTSMTIAIGWVTYRPLIGIPLLLFGVACVFYGSRN